MTISAKVLADSLSPNDIRLTTFQVTCHRFVLAEVNTHRVFSRNWRSSRAVPVKKLIEEVRANPAMPVRWGSNKPGMQAGEELSGQALIEVQQVWRAAATTAAHFADGLMQSGLAKEVANRVIEPFLYVHGVITSTEWDNFYRLRRHADAQPEIHALADAMHEAQGNSMPVPMERDAWHLPYVNINMEVAPLAVKLGWEAANLLGRLLSAARCARVSYALHDDTSPHVDADKALAYRLLTSHHLSPFEHQATPDRIIPFYSGDDWDKPNQHRNLVGWRQSRALFEANYKASVAAGYDSALVEEPADV